jgi:hypothetical protein
MITMTSETVGKNESPVKPKSHATGKQSTQPRTGNAASEDFFPAEGVVHVAVEWVKLRSEKRIGALNWSRLQETPASNIP